MPAHRYKCHARSGAAFLGTCTCKIGSERYRYHLITNAQPVPVRAPGQAPAPSIPVPAVSRYQSHCTGPTVCLCLPLAWVLSGSSPPFTLVRSSSPISIQTFCLVLACASLIRFFPSHCSVCGLNFSLPLQRLKPSHRSSQQRNN